MMIKRVDITTRQEAVANARDKKQEMWDVRKRSHRYLFVRLLVNNVTQGQFSSGVS